MTQTAPQVAVSRVPTPVVRVRSAPRVIDTDVESGDDLSVQEIANQLAADMFRKNAEKNKLAKEEKELHTKLLAHMGQNKMFTFNVDVDKSLKTVTLVGSEKVTIDIEALRKKAPDDKVFLEMVSSTQAAVKKHLGTVILAQVMNTTKGDDKVKITAAKNPTGQH